MVCNREDLGFSVEVFYWGNFHAACGGTEGGVLEVLEFFEVCFTFGGVREPGGTCIGEE